MEVEKAIRKRRSLRKFKQNKIDLKILKKLLGAARLAPSAANIQPLKYILVTSQNWLDLVFPTLKWAAYIAPEGNPKQDEKPTAYIIILVDKTVEKFPSERDVGAAAENILLLATAKGLAACWIASVDKEKLGKDLKLSSNYKIDSVIALGYPKEESEIEDWKGDLKYFKDSQAKMHVPKRKLESLLIAIK
ncbi:MAG: nitroreductase family protein [Candidatus Omnitrophota bacterium]